MLIFNLVISEITLEGFMTYLNPFKASYKVTDFMFTWCIHLRFHHMSITIPYSQFLRLRRLCSDGSDYLQQNRGNVAVFRKTWLSCFCCSSRPPQRQKNWSTVSTTNGTEGKYRYYSIHTHIHPRNQAAKSTILRNFKLLQKDPEIGSIFSQPPLISFKSDHLINKY